MKFLKDVGFSEAHILSMFRRCPKVFATSERKIKEVTELLLNLGNLDISTVAQQPLLLTYNATRRIRPRLEIIGILKSKGLLARQPKVTSVCHLTDESFVQRFVIPYASDIGEAAEKYISSRNLLVCTASS